MKTISFCITTKNRLYQLSKTLGSNLNDNRNLKEKVEFVIVDFGSEDGTRDWILENFGRELDECYLKYFYTEELKDWHASTAKNTAHLLAAGEFLVNLDCDNLTGINGGHYVITQFSNYGQKLILHQFSGNWPDGSYGRIGMHRKFFFKIGGYDQSFEPMGHQDVDLINRLQEFGLKYRRSSDARYNRAIPNSKSESIRYCDSVLSWEEMQRLNAKTSIENLLAGRLIANGGQFGICRNIYSYHQGSLARFS